MNEYAAIDISEVSEGDDVMLSNSHTGEFVLGTVLCDDFDKPLVLVGSDTLRIESMLEVGWSLRRRMDTLD